MEGVRIVVAGEAKTGKSSLINSAGDTYRANILAEAMLLGSFPLTITDTSSSIQCRDEVGEELKKADVVVLTYACDRPKTLDKLSSYWLPELRRLEVKVPVIVVGCKMDKMKQSDMLNLEQDMSLIKKHFREIETCIMCSTSNQTQVAVVFFNAQKAVLYPKAPLFDMETQILKPRCARALKRIFLLLDKDMDGALSDKELNDFMIKYFDDLLDPSEVISVKSVVQKELPSGVNDNGLTLSGFITLQALFIKGGLMEITWTFLRKFRYNNDLRLAVDKLSIPTRNFPDQSVELTNESVEFLKGVFDKIKLDNDGSLGPLEVEDLFSTAPDNPWNEAPYKDAAEKNVLGGLTLNGFLSLWALMALIDPRRCIEYLIYIGYKNSPASAIRITRRKPDRKKRQSDRNVYQCFVLGPKEAGKTAILDSFIGRPFSKEYAPTSSNRYAVNIIKQPGGNNKTLVLHEIPEDEVEILLRTEDALAACDLAVIVHDRSSAPSWRKANELLLKIVSHGEKTSYEVPSLTVAAKADLRPYSTEPKYSAEASEDIGIYSPIPLSTKMGGACHIFCKIVWAAEQPLSRMFKSALSTKDEQLWSNVRADELDFNAWTALILETERMLEVDIKKIRTVYDAFLSKFPLSYRYWQKYIDHEVRIIGSKDRVKEVYEQAVSFVRGMGSVNMWSDYCVFTRTYGDPETIRSLFERGLAQIGTDYLSHPLWDAYIAYERAQSDWRRVAMLYTRVLEYPKKGLDQYFEGFKQLVADRPLSELLTDEEAAASAMDEDEGSRKYMNLRVKMFKKANGWNIFQTVIRHPIFHVLTQNDPEHEQNCLVEGLLGEKEMKLIIDHMGSLGENPGFLQKGLLLAAHDGSLRSYINFFNVIEATIAKNQGRLQHYESRYRKKGRQATTIAVIREKLLTLPHGSDVQDADGWSALHCAVYGKRLEMVHFLIKKIQLRVNVQDLDGNSPLHLAASKLNFDFAVYMVQEDGVVNAINNAGYTALHLAAAFHSFVLEDEVVKFMELLVRNGSRVNSVSLCGTPLHSCSIRGNVKGVALLLSNKANVNSRSQQGFTPIILALIAKSYGCVKLLLQANALAISIFNGLSAVVIAVLTNQTEAFKLLLKYKGKFSVQNRSYLHDAIIVGWQEGQKILFKKDESDWNDNDIFTVREMIIDDWNDNDISAVHEIIIDKFKPLAELARLDIQDAIFHDSFQVALTLCTTYLLMEPDNSDIQYQQAYCWYKLGCFKEAEYYIHEMLRRNRHPAKLNYLAGKVKEKLKEYREAKKYYSIAISNNVASERYVLRLEKLHRKLTPISESEDMVPYPLLPWNEKFQIRKIVEMKYKVF